MGKVSPRINLRRKCTRCHTEFEQLTTQFRIDRRLYTKHCSRSCANHRIEARLFDCLNCDKTCKQRGTKVEGKFCSKKCCGEYEFSLTKKKFELGLLSERMIIRKVLLALGLNSCNICFLKDWNDKPITLQVDHIDGNAANNFPNNLRLLCPNCHSQTDTWGGRNRGNGRKAKGLKLN